MSHATRVNIGSNGSLGKTKWKSREETGTANAIHLTMITVNGVHRNSYWNDVQSEVTLDDLFRD